MLHEHGVQVWRCYSLVRARLARRIVPTENRSLFASIRYYSTAISTNKPAEEATCSPYLKPSPPCPPSLPITLFSGFLGAGKTTLLRHLIRASAKEGKRVAVLVNDMAQFNVDEFLMDTTRQGAKKPSYHSSSLNPPHASGILDYETPVMALTSGCICCSIKDDLAKAIRDFAFQKDARQVDHLLIECSGISLPLPVAAAIVEASQRVEGEEEGDPIPRPMHLDAVITVIDAPSFLTTLRGSESLQEAGLVAEGSESADESVAEILASQAETANIIVINKLDQLVDSPPSLTSPSMVSMSGLAHAGEDWARVDEAREKDKDNYLENERRNHPENDADSALTPPPYFRLGHPYERRLLRGVSIDAAEGVTEGGEGEWEGGRGTCPESLGELTALLKKLNPTAQVLATRRGCVPPSALLSTGLFDFRRLLESPGWMQMLQSLSGREGGQRGAEARKGVEDYQDQRHICGPGCDHDHSYSHNHSHNHSHSHSHSHNHSHDHDRSHDHKQNQNHNHSPHSVHKTVRSFVYFADRPFHPQRLMDHALSLDWKGVWRSKGFFWLATRSSQIGVWQSAGGSWQSEAAGEWECRSFEENKDETSSSSSVSLAPSAPPSSFSSLSSSANKTSIVERGQYQNKKVEMTQSSRHMMSRSSGPSQQIVWIGTQAMDEHALRCMLDTCLLTDEEMAKGPESWAREFEDPLPEWD